MARAVIMCLALGLLAGCGHAPAPAGLAPLPGPVADRQLAALAGLWMEELPRLTAFYWLRGDGTGELLRRGEGWKDTLPLHFDWSVEAGQLRLKMEGQAPVDVGLVRQADATLTLERQGETVTWYGCGSGRLPEGYAGLCGLSGF